MEKVEIVCPDCGKLITKISTDSRVTIFGYCRRCKRENTIRYSREARYRATEPSR